MEVSCRCQEVVPSLDFQRLHLLDTVNERFYTETSLEDEGGFFSLLLCYR